MSPRAALPLKIHAPGEAAPSIPRSMPALSSTRSRSRWSPRSAARRTDLDRRRATTTLGHEEWSQPTAAHRGDAPSAWTPQAVSATIQLWPLPHAPITSVPTPMTPAPSSSTRPPRLSHGYAPPTGSVTPASRCTRWPACSATSSTGYPMPSPTLAIRTVPGPRSATCSASPGPPPGTVTAGQAERDTPHHPNPTDQHSSPRRLAFGRRR